VPQDEGAVISLRSFFMRFLLSVLLLCLCVSPAIAQTDLHGIDVSDLNRKTDPCTDFYEFANGTWRSQNPIPASMTRWSKRWAAGETTKDKLRELLDEAAKQQSAAKGSTEQLIGDYYGSCMNVARIDERGIEPLKPWFADIDNANDMPGLQKVIERMHDINVTVPFGLGSLQDPQNPTMVIADIGASGFAMPERDYYVGKEQRFMEAREKYNAHMIAMFKLAGWNDADAAKAAKTVLDLETKLADATLSLAEQRDPKNVFHPTKLAELQAMTPHVDWAKYLDHKQVADSIGLNVEQPNYMKALDRQLQETSLADWKIYLKWQLLNSTAEALSEPIVDEDFAFNGKYLGGATEKKPRWKRCVESTDQALGEALGQKYVEKYFPPEAKARMQEMIANLLAAMKDDITTRPWMSDATRQQALAKLATFHVKVGYPDKWKDYSKVEIRRDSFFEDYVAGRKYVVEDDRATIGKPVDRTRWGMTPPTSDAYYNPLMNEIVFPAGILQPPAFDINAVDAVNYGAIGVVIGHEISHGFDDEGAQFDADGALKNWWTADDMKNFQARGACVADQFDHYFIEPGVHHNGKLVLGESIGDLGGVKIAFMAYQKSLQGKPRPSNIDGFTPEQQFFIAWGQFRGDEIRPEQARLMVQADPHPIAKYRVNGPLANSPEFQKAFQCKDDAAMVRAAGKRCEVW
jgi:endothelin-converting enzyme/putative endopeptidase